MKFAAHQPNFCPWIGYFAKLHTADVFVILDDVQMPGGQSYVSRTRIRGASEGEPTWLSTPTRSEFPSTINQVRLGLADGKWRARHLNVLKDRYRKAACFSDIYPILEACYAYEGDSLVEFNMGFLRAVADLLDIRTPFRFSSEFAVSAISDERLAHIGSQLAAEAYISGAGADAYQTKETYARSGIRLEIMDVRLAPDPIPNIGLSIIDPLMTMGPEPVKAFLSTCRPAPTP
ncbi:WbqC family protein [Caulobacter sp. NIBR1757]|uniref:WbqC family protein n=1 Tax=Caulobacter sp. NIBR1757 TaxID=3016000 RepID=UPI0022F04C4F|nr:WbqC family protein [Caulobacter sp. NIBR1757]WGM40047.1 hypothetical protein AMEJIAPC_02988 [Caulobacter sp. NIBR1757]